MDHSAIEQHLRDLEHAILPETTVVLDIISAVEQILLMEPNLIEISGRVTVVGDLHGQFPDFLQILKASNFSVSTNNDNNDKILFLGDYVDRGFNSVELILYILLLKLRNPDRIILLRGNHENRAQTSAYGFAEECKTKYNYHIYWRVCDLFEFLPMAAVINKTYFCIHGGLTPGLTLKKILNTDRTDEFSLLGQIMWGDPSDEVEYFQESQRGAGFLFGSKAVHGFLDSTGYSYLVRSHQLVFDGILENFDGKCITVWSAPNYCYKCKNLAAVMVVDGTSHSYIFFDAVPVQRIVSSSRK